MFDFHSCPLAWLSVCCPPPLFPSVSLSSLLLFLHTPSPAACAHFFQTLWGDNRSLLQRCVQMAASLQESANVFTMSMVYINVMQCTVAVSDRWHPVFSCFWAYFQVDSKVYFRKQGFPISHATISFVFICMGSAWAEEDSGRVSLTAVSALLTSGY